MNPRYEPGGDKWEQLKADGELLSREEKERYERENFGLPFDWTHMEE